MREAPRPGVEIRQADPSDAGILAETIVGAFEAYRGRLVPESGALHETADGIRRELQGEASAFLATVDGRVVGCVMVKPVEGDLYFGRLAVKAEARGRSVGRALVEAVEAAAHRLQRPGVRLSVRVALPENQRFFAAQGYREVGRGCHPGFEAPTFIDMRKPIP